MSRQSQRTSPGRPQSTRELAKVERAATALREKFVEDFCLERDSSALHFFKSMAFFHQRHRVMLLSEGGIRTPEFDQDDLDATRTLREELGQYLGVLCKDLAKLVSGFVEDLCRMRRDIDWIELEAEKIWPLLSDEYQIWAQIACDRQPANQDWRAPGWLNKWPADLPPNALLSAARGGRLSAHSTAKVLKEIANRINERLVPVQKSALANLGVRPAHENETARQSTNAAHKSPSSGSGPWSDSVANRGDDKPAAPASASNNPYAEVHAKGLYADREKARGMQRFLEPGSREWQQYQETIDAIDDKLLELSERAKGVARNVPDSPNAVLGDVSNTAPALPAQPKAKRGPQANMKFHHAVAKLVRSFEPNWRKHLEQIVRKLDKRKLPPLARWAKRNPPARSWERAWQHHSDVVLKAIEYSLEMAAKDIVGKPSETLGNLR